jgi:glycosyltransferase involved in cell wall biosynthesis
MVGEGEERPILEKNIEEYGLMEVVTLTGQLQETLPVLAAMDIATLCSSGESLSNSIIEYMACSLPVVVSDVEGNREALGEGNGLVFRSGDRKDFSDKLEQLILDPQMSQNLGCKAREYARISYEQSSNVEKHQKLYEQYASAEGAKK